MGWTGLDALSGALLAVGGGAVIAALSTDSSLQYHAMLLWGGIAAIILGAIGFGVSIVKKQDRAAPAIDQRVTSHNQSGGVTAHTVNVGTREPNTIYQDGIKVGTVANGAMDGDDIIFGEIRFTASVDTSRPVQFQSASLLCETPNVVATAAMFLDLHENVRCKIVG